MQRGDYRSSPSGTFIFTLGRLINIPLQFYILTSLPFYKAFPRPPPPSGGSPIAFHFHPSFAVLLSTISPRTISTITNTLLLTPNQLILLIMSLSLITKHLIWVLYIRRERMTIQFAFFGGIADIIFESIETICFTFASINPFFSSKLLYIAPFIHIPAVLVEVIAELQRKSFKDAAGNRGKVCTTGPWALARHINYGCNIIFGFGFGMACGGVPVGIMFGGVYVLNFVFNALGSHEEYCQERYREKWTEYCEKVPWKLIPWVY